MLLWQKIKDCVCLIKESVTSVRAESGVCAESAGCKSLLRNSSHTHKLSQPQTDGDTHTSIPDFPAM